MKQTRTLLMLGLFVCCAMQMQAQQSPEVKFVADTLIVQAEGSYESDPDLAILAFDVSAQEKELKQAYAKASLSMSTIVNVAEKNGLSKEAIHTGVLTVTPFYEGDRKRRARAYRVQGQVVLRIADFSKVGPIMDDSVQDGIVDFRSLTYSLSNEEAAKQKAVADAMRRALGRANIALEQSRQKLGPTRYVNLEVKNLVGVAQVQGGLDFRQLDSVNGNNYPSGNLYVAGPLPAPPPVRPEKITISATVQCVFQIEK